MGALRRIAVVGRSSRIHDLAQEVTQEVLLADDLSEACDIVETAPPDLTVFDGTVSPSDIRGFRERTQP